MMIISNSISSLCRDWAIVREVASALNKTKAPYVN